MNVDFCFIRSTCQDLHHVKNIEELQDCIYYAIRKYSLTDLQYIRGFVEREYRNLPGNYKAQIYPKTLEQIFGAYHSVIISHSTTRIAGTSGQLPLIYLKFCDMVENTLIRGREEDAPVYLLYYLLSAYTMFVKSEPGHPVGTPFPGGASVKRIGKQFICPVKDKTAGVETAICPFCPAEPDIQL